MSGSEEIVTSVNGNNIMPDPPVVSSAGNVNVLSLPPSSTSATAPQSELPDLAGEIARSEVLNSTTQSERSDRSRGSNRSRASITDDMLAEMRNMSVEMRAMNRNIALMLSSQAQERGQVHQFEDKLNVSEQFINTAVLQ
jgi:hypothetical protein